MDLFIHSNTSRFFFSVTQLLVFRVWNIYLELEFNPLGKKMVKPYNVKLTICPRSRRRVELLRDPV